MRLAVSAPGATLASVVGVRGIVYGRGSLDRLGEILGPRRGSGGGRFAFLVDDYFAGGDLPDRLPAAPQDRVIFFDATRAEPTTGDVDRLRDEILEPDGVPAGVVGIGGGSVLDLAKAVAVMCTQEGPAARYQGVGLPANPAVYHCGVPTISGTGAEVSMTAVLTGPARKLGIKCEWTPFDQLVLDPALPATVPREQWFYTGMDCYIHCIEARAGRHANTFSRACGDQALKLCREVFLGEESGRSEANDERLMVASLLGGLTLGCSEVGVCHAISYGLSYVLGLRHGVANCLAFRWLSEFYPRGVDEFEAMVERHGIHLPTELAAEWSDDTVTQMARVALGLEHMWDHALGPDWRDRITLDAVCEMYRRL